MNKKTKINVDIINRGILILTGVLLPSQILAIKIIPFFVITLICWYVIKILLTKKILFSLFNCVLISLTFVMMILMLIGNLPSGWKESSRNQLILYLVIIFSLFIKLSKDDIEVLIIGLKKGVIINIVWSIIQFVLNSFQGLDINDFIFNQILHIRDEASTIKYGYGLTITGLNWHPAQLVPIIIIGYYLFDDVKIKIILAILAMLSTNSTCIIAIGLCFFLDIIKKLFTKKRNKISVRDLLILVLGGIGIFAFLESNLFLVFIDRINEVFIRINSIRTANNMTNSSILHLRYYIAYPSIIKKYGILSFLFGIGFECSGYPFSVLFRQYNALKSWHVESDIINDLIGRGVIWTIINYGMLFYIALRGKKIDVKYLQMIVVLIICGIFYNNQFLWVELFLYITFRATKYKYNIFCIKQNNE